MIRLIPSPLPYSSVRIDGSEHFLEFKPSSYKLADSGNHVDAPYTHEHASVLHLVACATPKLDLRNPLNYYNPSPGNHLQ